MTSTEFEERQAIWAAVCAAMKVTVPEGTSGDVRVARFTVGGTDAFMERLAMMKGGRGVRQGTYTGLYRRGGLWMSDTPDERRDHMGFLSEVLRAGDKRVLVTGLGLGMVVAGLAEIPSVEHVTVVDIDPDVIRLVGPHVQRLLADAGKGCLVVQGDAKDPKSWVGAEPMWDSAWHDIWKDLCTDNLPEMASMSRRYARRVGRSQEFWGRELLRSVRRREQANERIWGRF